MFFDEQKNPKLNLFKSYGEESIILGSHTLARCNHARIILPQALFDYPQLLNYQQLSAQHLDYLKENYNPELILVDSGAQHKSLAPEFMIKSWQNKIGCESMTSNALCYTYNILIQEGRSVLAVLFF